MNELDLSRQIAEISICIFLLINFIDVVIRVIFPNVSATMYEIRVEAFRKLHQSSIFRGSIAWLAVTETIYLAAMYIILTTLELSWHWTLLWIISYALMLACTLPPKIFVWKHYGSH